MEFQSENRTIRLKGAHKGCLGNSIGKTLQGEWDQDQAYLFGSIEGPSQLWSMKLEAADYTKPMRREMESLLML